MLRPKLPDTTSELLVLNRASRADYVTPAAVTFNLIVNATCYLTII